MIADMGRATRIALLTGIVLVGLGTVLVGAAYMIDAVRYASHAGSGKPASEIPSEGAMRQYLVPADVTQEDAGTCWVEVRESGKGHIVCFAPGEESRFRPYARESVTDDGETWTTR